MPHPIKTPSSGNVVFDKYFIGLGDNQKDIMPGSIGVLDNGTWCYFPTAKAIESKDIGARILRDINPSAVVEFTSWWDRKEDEDDDLPRELIPLPSGELIYADTGDPVTKISDIYAYYPPESPLLDMALRLFRFAEEDREAKAQQIAIDIFDPKPPEEKKKESKSVDPSKIVCECGRTAKTYAGLKAHQRHCLEHKEIADQS